MKASTFLEQTLEIAPPWYVESVGLDRAAGVFSVHLNFERGGTFTCGSCDLDGCKAYDTCFRRWRHLDFFEYRTFLYAPSPRVKCPRCGIRQARLPWARARGGFTQNLERLLADLAEDLPMTSIARFLGEHDTRLGYLLRNRKD